MSTLVSSFIMTSIPCNNLPLNCFLLVLKEQSHSRRRLLRSLHAVVRPRVLRVESALTLTAPVNYIALTVGVPNSIVSATRPPLYLFSNRLRT